MKSLFAIGLSLLMLVGLGTDVYGFGYERPDWVKKHLAGECIPKSAEGNLKPEYPEIARKLGIEGKVLLSVDVDSSGRVKTIGVRESSGYLILDQAAISAVTKWRYIPVKSCSFISGFFETIVFKLPVLPVKITVESVPSNALMYIDRVFKGLTPLSVELPPDIYELRLESKGYQVYEEEIGLEKNKSLKISLVDKNQSCKWEGYGKGYGGIDVSEFNARVCETTVAKDQSSKTGDSNVRNTSAYCECLEEFYTKTNTLDFSAFDEAISKPYVEVSTNQCYFKDEVLPLIVMEYILGVKAKASACDKRFGGHNATEFNAVLKLHEEIIEDWLGKLDKVPKRFGMTKKEYLANVKNVVSSLSANNPQLFTKKKCAVLPGLFKEFKEKWDNILREPLALYLVADQYYSICD